MIYKATYMEEKHNGRFLVHSTVTQLFMISVFVLRSWLGAMLGIVVSQVKNSKYGFLFQYE